MGFHSLISVSHDQFHEIQNSPEGFMEWLGWYINSGGRREAQMLEENTHHAVRVIAMRHSADNFIISRDKVGFPAKLPYEEELDEQNKAWDAAVTKAKAWLGKTLKLRTMAQVRELVVQLITKHPVSDAQILAADGAFFARRKLQDGNWKPTRTDYEALKNRLAKIEEVLGEPA